MDTHVLIQVALLSERLAAAEDWTDERFLLGVGPEVIEKVVPFFEASCARLVFAQKYLSPSLALWLKVFYILKCTKIRNMQALLESGKIHILALLEEHLGIIRYSNPVHYLLSCVGWRRIFCR